MAVVTSGDLVPLNIDAASVAGIDLRGNVTVIDATHFRIAYGGGDFDDFLGVFSYTGGKPTGGTVTQFGETLNGAAVLTVSGVAISMASLLGWADTGNNAAFLNAIFAGDDTVTGSPFADVLRSQGGDDVLTGGGGSDLIDGGAGTDTAVFAGRYQDYKLTNNTDGSIRIADLRAGAPDGTDTLVSIESLRFSDKTLSTVAPATSATSIAYANILRAGITGASAAGINDLNAQIGTGAITQAQATAQIIVTAGATTSVATLAYQFFTGKIPGSAGYDFLVSPSGPNANNLNSAYYQNFNLENRYINFAVNLGKAGEGAAAFNAAYGTKSLLDAAKQAYAAIFGGTPTDAKAHLLIDTRIDYFAAYGGDGPNGIGTKAAMVGWLLGEAIKADVGMLAKSNDAFLADLADGAAYNVDLVGVYGSQAFVVSG